MGAWWIVIFFAAGFVLLLLGHWSYRLRCKRLRQLSKEINDDDAVQKLNEAAKYFEEESKKGFFDKDEEI